MPSIRLLCLPRVAGGEPLTGKLTLPPGATVEHMLMESDDQKLLMASDAGYGFVCTFNDLVARNRAGKALITLPDNAHVMPPLVIEDESDMLLAITAAGRMLMFPVSDLPQLSKGKGNKIISIPAAEAAAGRDGLAHLFVLPPQSTLTIHVGKRKIKLRPEELQKVTGERGRRGSLMRGLQKIDRVELTRRVVPRQAIAKSSASPPVFDGRRRKNAAKSLFIQALRLTMSIIRDPGRTVPACAELVSLPSASSE